MNQAELAQTVQERVAKNPSVMTGALAQELGVKEVEIIRNLPQEMRVEVPASEFVAVWEEMVTWEKITFLNISSGCILEVQAKLPKGAFGHGYFNMHDADSPIGGHIMHDKIGSIWLVSKPFFKLESHCVLVFDTPGDLMFGVFLGRDDKKHLLEDVKKGFLRLRETYLNHKE